MRTLLVVVAASVFANSTVSQDKVTLSNGDVVTGKVVSMADGKVTVQSPVMGDIVVSLADVKDMVTGAPVTLQTTAGQRWERRILGIADASLRLSGDGASALPIARLGMINPPPEKEPEWTGSLKLTGPLHQRKHPA